MAMIVRPDTEENRAAAAVDPARQPRITPEQVKGWGIDADPKNDPTYPMRKRNGSEHEGYGWERPPQQPITVPVLHSNERPNVSAVYGTSSPPAGLSGAIRKAAFQFSESSYGHWVPLMLADRIGVVEGVLGDLAHGRIPNIPAELGLPAQWRHNPKAVIAPLFVGAVLVGAAMALLDRRKNT